MWFAVRSFAQTTNSCNLLSPWDWRLVFDTIYHKWCSQRLLWSVVCHRGHAHCVLWTTFGRTCRQVDDDFDFYLLFVCVWFCPHQIGTVPVNHFVWNSRASENRNWINAPVALRQKINGSNAVHCTQLLIKIKSQKLLSFGHSDDWTVVGFVSMVASICAAKLEITRRIMSLFCAHKF